MSDDATPQDDHQQQDDQASNDAHPGGEQGGGSDQSNGFKAITSQDDLDRIIRDRLGRERKKLAKDIRTEIETETQTAAAKEQGEYRKLYEELQPKYDTATQERDTVQVERDSLAEYFDTQYTTELEELPDVVKAFKPADDASFAEKSKWLTVAREQAKSLAKDAVPGNGPNPKPGAGEIDMKTALTQARRVVKPL